MKRLIAFILSLAALSTGAGAQILSSAHPEEDAAAFARVRARMDSIRRYRPTVGLVLAGGGARGLAHLGVIRYMEELGIPVDVVTGTSMGGLVGGLYALGYTPRQLDSLVRAVEWPVMMSDNIPNDYIGYDTRKYRDKYLVRIPHHYDNEDLAARLKNERIIDRMAQETGHNTSDMLNESISRMGLGMPDGFLYGLNVRNMLSSVSVGYQDSISFADLPIPFACVATDLYAMAPKYWTSGSITDALRSTMAIPFYFRAVRKDGEVLLDGGMRNNYPVDVARAMGADIIIGSDMSIHRELNELNTPVDFLMQTITLLASSANGPAREMLDLGVHHELKGYSMLSFDEQSVDDIIAQGYRNALENKELFESIAQAVAHKADPGVATHAPAVNLAQGKVRVKEVRFDGIGPHEQARIHYQDDMPSDGLYDRAVIERILNDLYGTNAFESVTYRMEGAAEPYTLVFDCRKGQTNDFALGLRADTDETVAVALHYGLGTRRLTGMRLSADLKLGTNPALTVDWGTKSRIGLPSYGVVLRAGFMNTQMGWTNDTFQQLLSTALDGYLEDTRMKRGKVRFGLTAEMMPFEKHMQNYVIYGSPGGPWDWRSYWLSGFGSFKYDTFDDGYFPRKGVRMSLNARYIFKGRRRPLQIDMDMYDYSTDEEYESEGEALPAGEEEGQDGGPVVPDEFFTRRYPVNPYFCAVGSISAAFTVGQDFTILPSFYLGYSSTTSWSEMNLRHVVGVGGFLPNRYTELQIPFFGFSTGFRDSDIFTAVPQLDLRYRFLRKNFVTARAGLFLRGYSLTDMFIVYPVHAYGVEYARQSIVGPLRLAVQWCNITGVTAYASIGFDF